ncbi:hypothetical protein H696_00879 [Fonticula alba]|uniref:Uncharacterized protein n=1 Tax=Fonticula alba TaxID=691883 RepID=A0A058ZG19_FONAL|nr:hypothetical protein H696_00879 [Fonticula alba]KCV73340.1 hypothetical protein H696_00879 [Fonticula alba]|eukprot:XP_009493041.1 hypothetical protein H696_00879 [Fonticula alba]
MSFLRTVISIAQTALNILSPIDQFKEHWRNVNNYYRYNNVSEEGDNVAQHYLTEDLSEMLIILKKECLPDQTPTAGSATDLGDLPPGALPPSPLENMVTGPCLEFVMSSQMLDWLTKKAIMDSPRGMRCLVMDFFASFLGCIHGPLLPEAVHKPLTRLLEESKRVSPNYQRCCWCGVV